MFSSVYKNRSVFVTGHTGFKGSWLCQWLLNLGAKVHGFALDPQPHEKLFDQLQLQSQMASDVRGDVRDLQLLQRSLQNAQPDIVFHLAAQPLVRLSYSIPVETFSTNVMGTIHLLESIRQIGLPCTCVVVTTDKCYENRECLGAYREDDPMGGHDPYSASKGCAELATAGYRNSYFRDCKLVRIATARAGNVIGGGDWAMDRIVPDIFRALDQKKSILVRNKHATRPWQHVLEPLSGYLWLAARMFTDETSALCDQQQLCSAFNFGPNLSSNKTVADLVKVVLEHVPGNWNDGTDLQAPHEASKLNLAIDKAFHCLQWTPTWDFEQSIAQTVKWYMSAGKTDNIAELTRNQILFYSEQAATRKQLWADCDDV